MSLYTFRIITDDDLPMVEEWLHSPEATQWWGEPSEQLALIREDFAIDEMRQWIVLCDDKPFAYAQAYGAKGTRVNKIEELRPFHRDALATLV